jgi:integrase
MKTSLVTAGKDGAERIRDESGTYIARYRDGDGMVIEVSTGCRDKTAAQNVLADLERKAERVRSGLLTPAEARTAAHLATPIGEHVAEYATHLEAVGTSPKHCYETRRRSDRVLNDCRFATLGELDRGPVETWLVGEAKRAMNGMSARTRNTYLASLNAFANWCIETGRLTFNPVEIAARADERTDRRRQRRSLTEAELVNLLVVARRRPLRDALTVRRGKRKGQAVAKLKPEVRKRLEAFGRERGLIYKTLVLTGLRLNELATLTVGQLRLDDGVAFAELDAADEKSREGNSVAIRDDLAADLRDWLGDKLVVI